MTGLPGPVLYPLGPAAPGLLPEPHTGRVYPISLNDVGLMLNPTSEGLSSHPFRNGFLPTRKQQLDVSAEPGEQSLSSDMWRRSRSSWHEGAGQDWVDAQESVTVSSPFRFASSRGVDVWTKNELSLLYETERKQATAAASGKLLVVGGYLYWGDSDSGTPTLRRTTDPLSAVPTFTTITGVGASGINDLCTDGRRIYVAEGDRLSRGDVGGATVSSFEATSGYRLVRIANGFLLAASVDPTIFVINDAGVRTDKTPAIVSLTTGTLSWLWTAAADGPNGPYIAGKSNGGDLGWIFRGVLNSSGGLDYFTVAAVLPDGEGVESMISYLNSYVIIGTNKGVRLGVISQDTGNINYGPLIVRTPRAVKALEAQGEFVWFGWRAYTFDGVTYTGLGRLNLATFTDTLRPAYAADLLVAGEDQDVDSIVTWTSSGRDYRLFTIVADGLHGETTRRVSSGELRTGRIRWATLEEKHFRFLDLRMKPLDGSIASAISVEDGAYTTISTISEADTIATTEGLALTGQWADLKLTLNRASADTTLGPTVTGFTLRAVPKARALQYWDIPFMLFDYEQLPGRDERVGFEGRALIVRNQLQEWKREQTILDFRSTDYGRLRYDTLQYPVYPVVIDDITFDERQIPGISDETINGFFGRLVLMEVEI